MISRTARTLTAVSALVLGFGPALVQAADANNTPYAKYLDCSSSQGRTTAGGSAGCVERGEVLNFGQLRDIIAAAMYRDEVERRNTLLRPDSDYRDRPDSSYTDGTITRPPGRNGLTPDSSSADSTTPIRLQDRPGSGNPSGSTAGTSTSDNGSVPVRPPERNDSTASSNGSMPDSASPARPQARPAQSTQETAEGTVAFPPALIPPSAPVVVRYERGTDDQSTPSSRLVFTVKDEAGESSSYSVNLSDEAGQYIEREIIRNPTARPAASSEVTAAEEPAAPLDMEEVVVSQELIPVSSDGQVLASTEAPTPAPMLAPSRPMAVPSSPQTPILAEMQSAPAPVRPTAAYFPPQVVIAESSVDNQPVMVSSYTVQQPAASPVYSYTYTVPQQPVTTYTYVMQQQPTVQYYRITVPGSTTPVDATPVVTLRVREQGDSQTTTTTTATTTNDTSTVTIQPYMIMISSTETVHVVPQQVAPQVNVLAALRDNQAATPGENVRDQSYTGTSDNPSTSPSAEPAAAPSNNDDDDDDDDGPQAP